MLLRDDLLRKMQRHALAPPPRAPASAEAGGEGGEQGAASAADDASEHLVQTVLDQGHLCPLPLGARPVVWNYDHALRLYV